MNIDHINEHYYGDLTDPKTERARERIHWICSQATGQDVLDIGCSQGIVCLILGREGFRCTGADIEAASLTVATKALTKEDKIVQDRVTFQVADASQLPFKDESFDTVVLGEILEHLTHPLKVLAEAKRVLRQGGRVIITVPHGLNAYHDHKQSFYPISLLGLLQRFFKSRSLDSLNHYLVYTGHKEPGYSPDNLPKEALFDEYLRLEKMTETRCLEKEQELLETGTRLYAQISALSTQRTVLMERVKEMGEAIKTKGEQLQKLQAGLTSEQGSAAALREKTDQLQASQAQLRAELTKAQTVLTAAQEEREALAAEATALRRELQEREASMARLGADLTKAQDALKAAEDQRVALETDNTGLRGDFLAKAAELTAAQTALINAEATLAATRQQCAALEAETHGLRQELAAKTSAWQQRLTQSETMEAARARDRERQIQALIADREADWKRKTANQRVREVVRAALPAGALVLVVSRGDDDLLQLDGRHGWHFPQGSGGVYAGYHPADSAAAIAHLETLRARGAEFLLIPATSFWWLDFYADFRRHLETHYRLLIYSEEACAIFALSPASPKSKDVPVLSFQRPSDKTPVTPAPSQSPAQRAAPAPDKAPPAPGAAPSAAGASSATSVSTRPTAPGARRTPRPANLTVGAILDEFTTACFAPECSLVTFRPDNWQTVLERTPIDMLLVESAWHGNKGAWQYKIASFKKPMGEEVVDVVNYCKTHGIPTVFWNKEDPPHFDRFIHRASLFDVIFTSDGDMIPRYRKELKHDRIFALPFAAQPQIHHPILEKHRLHDVCFAGAYYAADHDERREDMEMLLRPALPFGLHIYDRQHGLAGPDAKMYRFPDIYQPAIQGRLEYDDMVKAYKWYKVFLNVNSVKTSPTMFSRRVFELLASGTPVISAYAKGIVELLGSDIVKITRSEQETKAHLESLLQDEVAWARISLRGLREVLSHHTYAHRLAEVCRTVGLPFAGACLPKIQAVAKVDTARELAWLADTLKRQHYRRFSLTVLAGKDVPKAKLHALSGTLPDITVQIQAQGKQNASPVNEAAGNDYIWLMQPKDYYGDGFLLDAALASLYSSADVLGKHTHFEAEPGATKVALRQPRHEFRPAHSFSPGSVLARAGRLDAEQWKALMSNRTPVFQGLSGLSVDRFNYVRGGAEVGKARGRSARGPLEEVLV